MIFFSDNENFERGPPRHAGGNGNQGINFVWPNMHLSMLAPHRPPPGAGWGIFFVWKCRLAPAVALCLY